MKFPNRIKELLGNRTQLEMSRVFNVTAPCVNAWVVGRSIPNRYIINDEVKLLGPELTIDDVWPKVEV